MEAPAFDVKRFVRPDLRSLVFYLLIIVVSSVTIVKPAQASGTVNPSVLFWGGWGSSGNINCAGLPSLNAVKSCELAWLNDLLAQDIISLANNYPGITPNPLSCPTAVLTDSGPISPYVDVFHVTTL